MQAIEFIHPHARDRLRDSGCCPSHLAGTRLDHVIMALRSARTVEAIFDELVEHLQDDVPFDRLGLALLDEDGTGVVSRRVYSTQPLLVWGPGDRAPLLGSSLEPLLQEGAIRIIHDLKRYQQLRPSSVPTRRLLQEGMRSSLTIPLYDGASPLGFLFFTSRDPERYAPPHVVIAALLAPTVGRALGRAVAAERASASQAMKIKAVTVAPERPLVVGQQRPAPC